jgi:predicted ATPase/DNA-binding SARP family transcriptional activator/Tfp pilus assembly protein PilF
MGSLSCHLLGPVQVIGEAGEIPIHGLIRRRLLVRLLIAGGQAVPVERLREDLWDGRPPVSAASTLKSHISLLRRAIGPDRLVYRDGAYILAMRPDELDASLFEADVTAGGALLRRGHVREAADVLAGGLGRWRGRALGDAADTSWGAPEAVRLEELRAVALESWLEARLVLGEFSDVVGDAEAAVAEHPLREGLWAKLILALYGCGRQADALRAYQRLRERLLEELGVTPSPALVSLEASILRHDVRRPAIVHGDGAARTGVLSWGAPSDGNLPVELTSFISRPTELARLGSLIDGPGLVTLTGAGGTGKTRLALRAAREAAATRDAVWWCELAPIRDPAHIIREAAAAVGCTEQPGIPLSRVVAERLAEGTQLVVLDNCEHLLDAAGAFAVDLCRAAPRLRVLATSRSPLEVEGEAVHRVPSMSVPGKQDDPDDPEGLLGYESVRLLVERARAHQPDFIVDQRNYRAVAALCAQLDGIPLALELAAARLRTMSVSDIESRLDDRFRLLTGGARTAPPRQQTLEACIDWSFDLLDDRERHTLGLLSVFSGGFDLDAAEVVIKDGDRPVHDVVGSLLDKSLLLADMTGISARYRMLETVRAYASAKLPGRIRTAARTAHARYFLQLVELAAPHFYGSAQLAWRARLERDDDNLHAAFETLIDASDPEQALRFGSAACRFWNSRGLYGDEIDLVESALDRPAATDASWHRGRALAAAGYVLFRRGETARANLRLEEALRIARALPSAALAADALRSLAWVADRRGQRDAAIRFATEAVREATASGESHLMARAYDVRAAASQHLRPDDARADYARALRHCRAAGDGLGQASTLNNLAILELEQGRHHQARSYFSEALAVAEEVRDSALLPFLEYGVALTALLDGDLGAADPAFVRSLLSARRTGQRSLMAYAVLGIAMARTSAGRAPEAAVLLGASAAAFEDLGEQPEPTEAALRDGAGTTLRAALGEELESALAAGGRLRSSQLLDLAADGL